MTASSDRRRAELAVIEAARHVYCAGLPAGTSDWLALGHALNLLDRAPLAPADKARSGPALTSEMAAAFMRGKRVASVNARILRQLNHRTWDGYWRGYTVEELCRKLGGLHQTVSARVHELWREGWIVTGDKRRPTSSGVEADVYYLSEAARKMLNDGRQDTA